MIKVAIVGRVNTGKSTLFNDLVGSSVSITWKEPGTTRDVVEAIAHSKKRSYVLMDTAGYTFEDDPMYEIFKAQSDRAIEESDIVIAVFDVKSGFTDIDDMVRKKVIRSGKPFIFVVNKVDSKNLELLAFSEFSQLGKNFITVSALHKKNIEKIFEELDKIADELEKEKSEKADYDLEEEAFDIKMQEILSIQSLKELERKIDEEREKEIQSAFRREILKESEEVEETYKELYEKKEKREKIRISFVGRPNVGKSSLINAILGYERCVVYHEPGTTRDAIRIPFRFNNTDFILVDTPGLRKKSKIDVEGLEFKSVGRSLTAIFVSDVCVLVIDSAEGVTHQDKAIAGLIERRGRGLVVAFNKIDIIKELKPAGGIGTFVSALKTSLKFIKWAYFIPVSAKTKYGIDGLLSAIKSSYQSWTKKLKPSQLLKIRERLVQLDFMRNQSPKIFQLTVKPPTFLVYVNEPENLRKYQVKHIEKIIRQLYGFYGSPIHFRVKRHGEPY
ncbi:GTPase Der [bacterium HR19]|nr:GTPase Der [bacterium HR19]